MREKRTYWVWSTMALLVLAITIGVFFWFYYSPLECGETNKNWISDSKIVKDSQPSALFLINLGRYRACTQQPMAEQKFALLFDVYIKAKSYFFINKFFFIFSVIGAFLVILFPAVGYVLPETSPKKKLLSSSVTQTGLTAFALFMFTMYSTYKGRQNDAENLMRYVLYSEEPQIEVIAKKVTEELARIDQGYNFTVLFDRK
jgi:hypothetical protein